MFRFRQFLFTIFSLAVLFLSATAQEFNPNLYQNLRWRMIGPYRGGRTVGAAGAAQQPNVFYIGVCNGGVWKTNDYGRTWKPIFDSEPTGSIGTIAVAPSDPNIIYVGSGEGLHRPDLSVGDGVYKSTDAGTTWTHLGLRDGQQIPKIAIDQKNPDRIFVAVLGHPYGPNKERGIYRSVDGGKTFEKVLFKDENTGGDDVAIDPSDPNIVFATLWEDREGPWENGSWNGTNGGIFKSTDGGTTWRKLTNGLTDSLVQTHIAISPSNPNIVYTVISTTERNTYGTGKGMGLYRSDDKGEHWQKIPDDGRALGRIGGGDLPEIAVDPKNSETLFSTSISLWKSTDGGKDWQAIRGAPGGDDYQNIWINPNHSDIMLVTGDQGAIITVNGGETWSSWYNQPTAQLYHVATDNQFPYYVYGGQQESGSAGIASRGNDGEITFRDWHPVAAEEYAYIAPDPLHPNIIFGGKVSKYNRATGQVQNVAPEAVRSGKYRFIRTMPILFSPVDPHILFLASNVLFKTTNGGDSWETISPDLSREKPEVPACVGIFHTTKLDSMPRRGVIYAVAPSPKDVNVIWAGTDDGLVHMTWNGGKHWNDVTPKGISAWSKIAQIDAGHFDMQTAYVAVNRLRLDDLHPHIYRTHDGGKTWKEIVNGLPDNAPVNAVREDPQQKGLLFAGTEQAVFVSFNDGDTWQPLRLNMPASSVRDVAIHENDLVAATHGRSFWILDDITLLRQTSGAAHAEAFLFKPEDAYRVRWDMNTDTPLPPDEPAGKNPPDGAIIDYYLKSDAKEVSLEIFDHEGKPVRKFSSNDVPEIDSTTLPHPTYWIRPPQILSAKPGMQRFVWDLHFAPPEGIPRSYPIAAVYHDTPSRPVGPWVQPGEYIVKLTVDGKTYSQPLTVKMDPRVNTTPEELHEQYTLSMECYSGLHQLYAAIEKITTLRRQVKALLPNVNDEQTKKSLTMLLSRAAALQGGDAEGDIDVVYSSIETAQHGKETLSGLQTKEAYLMALLQSADVKPTAQAVAGVEQLQKSLHELLGRWNEIETKDVKAVNEQLRRMKLQEIVAGS
ncbi:MAG: glycoside hydrolase [Bacteroidota bacterium]|nr:glycoside hydrolase [Bacteroidota bacterium]